MKTNIIIIQLITDNAKVLLIRNVYFAENISSAKTINITLNYILQIRENSMK